MDYAYLYGKILETYRKCSVNSFPIDCFDIAQKLGFSVVRYSDLDSAKRIACLKLSHDACLIKRLLCYNDAVLPERIRFSLMHEIGHIVLETNSEKEADAFASHILAPRIAVHFMYPKTVNNIHDTFGISYTAADIVLENHRNWLFAVSQRIPRLPTTPEIEIKSLLNIQK